VGASNANPAVSDRGARQQKRSGRTSPPIAEIAKSRKSALRFARISGGAHFDGAGRALGPIVKALDLLEEGGREP
jgi:hypothetical protein